MGTPLIPTRSANNAALPSITGRPASRADVTQSQHRGPVGDDGDRVVELGELVGGLRIALDGKAHARNAGRVDVPQNLQGVDRETRYGLDLAAAVAVEHPIRLADEARVRQLVDAIVETAIRLLVHLQRDFPQRSPLVAAQRGQVLDGETRIGDDQQHTGQAAGLVERFDNQNFRNLHRRCTRLPAALRRAKRE